MANNFHDSDGSPQSTNERLEELYEMFQAGGGGGTGRYRLVEDPPGSGDYKTEVESF